MKALFLSALLLCCFSAQGQVIFSEDFDGIGGPTAGGTGTYSFPGGWLLRNVDNSTPATAVNYVNEAWERREDFNFSVLDSAAFSTSWYTPAGTSNDWMWTPVIAVQPNTDFKWNAVTYDAAYPDGYEVRIMSLTITPGGPTGGSGTIGNQVTNSTVLFSIPAENTTWTARQVSLNAYAGQNVRLAFRNNSTDKFLLLIDDVVAIVNINNDLSVVAGSTSHGEYTVAPANQQTTTQNIQLKGAVTNPGIQAATNVRLGCRVSVDGTLLTTVQSAATPSMAAGATIPMIIDYFPTVEGNYTFKFFPLFNETDQATANDTVSDPTPLLITPTQMRRDNGVVTGSLGIGAGNGGFIGQTYRFENPVNVASISSYMTRGYVNRQLRAVIFNTNGAGVPTTLLASTDTLVYPDDSARLYTMPIYGGTLNLPAGEYAFLQVEIDSTLALGSTDAIFTPNSMYVYWPTSPSAPNFAAVETFGASFAKPFVIYPDFDLCVGIDGGSVASVTPASCGMSDGTAELALDPGFSVVWEDSSTNTTISGLAAGYHTYTLMSEYCTFTDSVEITNPSAPTVAVASLTDVLCFGGSGQAILDIQNGQSPYTVVWSEGTPGTTLTAPAGTYSATVTDDNNCQSTISGIVITQPASALASTASGTDETCASCDDGTATVVPSGGTSPYTVLWDNGGTTASITGLAPGTYTATITDDNGCTTTQTVTVAEFIDVTGIEELANYGISVYPNPVLDLLTVKADKTTITAVALTDASGKTISQLTKANNTYTLDMRSFAKGMYHVVITTKTGTVVTKVTKQ